MASNAVPWALSLTFSSRRRTDRGESGVLGGWREGTKVLDGVGGVGRVFGEGWKYDTEFYTASARFGSRGLVFPCGYEDNRALSWLYRTT